ncbi:MAG: WD40 repeat domain-containing protein [Bacteroidetes bacterium]|nr:WD40 repeat domain-containing protein [Bacteroidota bacterium]
MRLVVLFLLASIQFGFSQTPLEKPTTIQGHTNDLAALKFSNPKIGLIASGGWDNSLYIYKADSPFKLVKSFPAHGSAITCLNFNWSGTMIATGSQDFQVNVWDSMFRKVPILIDPKMAHTNNVSSVIFDRTGRFVFSGCEGGKLIIWDLQSKKAVKQNLTGVPISSLALGTMPSSIFVAGAEPKIKLVNLVNGQVLKTLEGHKDRINAIAVSKNMRFLLSGSNDKTAKIWDLKTFKLHKELPVECWKVTAVAFSDDSRYCATACNDGSIRIWETETGKLISKSIEQEFIVKDLSFNATATLIGIAPYMKSSSDFGPRIYRSGIHMENTQLIPRFNPLKLEMDSILAKRKLTKQDSARFKSVLFPSKIEIDSKKPAEPKIDSPRIYKTPMNPKKKI